jgi:hypothetical protein
VVDLLGRERDDRLALLLGQSGALARVAMILRSSTADRMIAETTLWMTEMVSGASAFRLTRLSAVPKNRTQACTSDGRIVAICRSPKVG